MESEESSTLWQRDESLRKIGGRLNGQRSGIRVVSFDFFDTLICRTCAEPSDLFIETGRRLAASGLLLRPFTPMEFHSARVAADERARKNASQKGLLPEIKLADIYSELKKVVSDAAQACAVEFEVERNFCFLNPAVASLARHAKSLGYKIAVVSDTYFTAEQLQQLLRENGLSPSLFDLFLVSCETGKSKWNSQLYFDLLRYFDLHPSELLHIGDNEHADIHVARQLGAQTAHYYKTNPPLDQVLRSEKNFRGSDFYPAGALNAVRILAARRAESDGDTFRDGALVFGPVLARYADWCVEKFKAANVRTVLALMREGELLGEMVTRSAAAAGLELKIATCFTSRRATALAGMSETTAAAALELMDGSATVTLQSILEVLELDDEIARQFKPEDLRSPLRTRENVNHVLKLLFENSRVRELIDAARRENFRLAFDYLLSLIGNETNVGVLDIGWGGSIQRNLARILRRGERDVRTVGCYLARTRKSGRLALDGDEVHAFMEQDWARLTILPELAITSPVGSTNGYTRDASGSVQPVLGAYSLSPIERRVKARLRDGILEFQDFWLQLRQQKNYSADTLDDIDRQTASIFYRLLEFPTKAEADRLGVLTHDENYFAENFSAPLCDELTPRLLRRDGVQAIFQAARCYWPQGVVARDNPRLVSALSLGWNDYFALGRIGARHSTPVGENGLTDEEVFTLGALVSTLSLRQIIFAGPLSPALAEVLQSFWKNESEAKLITVGPPAGTTAGAEFLSRCAQVDGELGDFKTIQAVRAELISDASSALVLPSDLDEATALGLLNGLAPFLGREGSVLAACGRFDRKMLLETFPLAGTLNKWLEANGNELGFWLLTDHTSIRAPFCNWLVFRRDPPRAVWNNQWMFTAADLVLAKQNDELLLTK